VSSWFWNAMRWILNGELILEENALGDHSRVERIATEKLQMQHVDPHKKIS
jgi:cell division protein FtsL